MGRNNRCNPCCNTVPPSNDYCTHALINGSDFSHVWSDHIREDNKGGGYATCLVVDGDGSLIIGGSHGGNPTFAVVKFDSTGTRLWTAEVDKQPVAVAVDSNYVYAVLFTTSHNLGDFDNVVVLDLSTGDFVRSWMTYEELGSDPNPPWMLPTCAVASTDGHVYIGGRGSPYLWKFDSNGNSVATVRSVEGFAFQSFSGTYGEIYALALDASGNVYSAGEQRGVEGIHDVDFNWEESEDGEGIYLYHCGCRPNAFTNIYGRHLLRNTVVNGIESTSDCQCWNGDNSFTVVFTRTPGTATWTGTGEDVYGNSFSFTATYNEGLWTLRIEGDCIDYDQTNLNLGYTGTGSGSAVVIEDIPVDCTTGWFAFGETIWLTSNGCCGGRTCPVWFNGDDCPPGNPGGCYKELPLMGGVFSNSYNPAPGDVLRCSPRCYGYDVIGHTSDLSDVTLLYRGDTGDSDCATLGCNPGRAIALAVDGSDLFIGYAGDADDTICTLQKVTIGDLMPSAVWGIGIFSVSSIAVNSSYVFAGVAVSVVNRSTGELVDIVQRGGLVETNRGPQIKKGGGLVYASGENIYIADGPTGCGETYTESGGDLDREDFFIPYDCQLCNEDPPPPPTGTGTGTGTGSDTGTGTGTGSDTGTGTGTDTGTGTVCNGCEDAPGGGVYSHTCPDCTVIPDSFDQTVYGWGCFLAISGTVLTMNRVGCTWTGTSGEIQMTMTHGPEGWSGTFKAAACVSPKAMTITAEYCSHPWMDGYAEWSAAETAGCACGGVAGGIGTSPRLCGCLVPIPNKLQATLSSDCPAIGSQVIEMTLIYSPLFPAFSVWEGIGTVQASCGDAASIKVTWGCSGVTVIVRKADDTVCISYAGNHSSFSCDPPESEATAVFQTDNGGCDCCDSGDTVSVSVTA